MKTFLVKYDCQLNGELISAGSTIEVNDKIASTLSRKVLDEVVDGVVIASNDTNTATSNSSTSLGEAVAEEALGDQNLVSNEVVGDVIEETTAPTPVKKT